MGRPRRGRGVVEESDRSHRARRGRCPVDHRLVRDRECVEHATRAHDRRRDRSTALGGRWSEAGAHRRPRRPALGAHRLRRVRGARLLAGDPRILRARAAVGRRPPDRVGGAGRHRLTSKYPVRVYFGRGLRGEGVMRRWLGPAVVLVAGLGFMPAGHAVPLVPPLRTSPNVQLVTNVPGSYAGLIFKDHYAFATSWALGLTVFDIADPLAPTPVGALSLPHFENEDVDLCGDTLLISNDRE